MKTIGKNVELMRKQVWLTMLEQKQSTKPVKLLKAFAYADECLEAFDKRFNSSIKKEA